MSPAHVAIPDTTVLEGWCKHAASPRGLADCSLVVPTYKRPVEMGSLVEHLARLPDVPAEVVVVDGSPDDLTEKRLVEVGTSADLPFDLVFVRSPSGLTRQRNVGIDTASGRIVYYLDDDCVPEAGYFETLRTTLDDPERSVLGAACGSIVNCMGGSLNLRWRLRLALRLVPSNEPGRFFPTATSVSTKAVQPFTGVRSTDMMPGGAAAYRREVLDRHRFSLFFDGYAQGEDLEMSCRIREAGWQLAWCGGAHVAHNHAPGGRPPGFAHGRMARRNRYFIWRRYCAHVPAREKLRFWGDVLFGLVFDLAALPFRRGRRRRLAWVSGGVLGIVDCLFSPPSYEEPAARPQFTVKLDVLS